MVTDLMTSRHGGLCAFRPLQNRPESVYSTRLEL